MSKDCVLGKLTVKRLAVSLERILAGYTAQYLSPLSIMALTLPENLAVMLSGAYISLAARLVPLMQIWSLGSHFTFRLLGSR